MPLGRTSSPKPHCPEVCDFSLNLILITVCGLLLLRLVCLCKQLLELSTCVFWNPKQMAHLSLQIHTASVLSISIAASRMQASMLQ